MATATSPQLKWLPKHEYRSAPGLSTSAIKRFAQDPYGYHLGLEKPTTAAMQFGRDLEDYLLAGELPDVVRMPDAIKIRRGKEYDAFAVEHAGKRLLKADEHDDLMENLESAATEVAAHAEARSILESSSDPWPSIFWQCPITGVDRKAELDLVCGTSAIIDLKTCADVSYHGFAAQAERLRYHWQAASYQQGAEAFSGHRMRVFFLCVQNSAPWNVEVYEMPQDWIDAGLDEVVLAIRRLQEAEQSGRWRSPTWGISVELERPRWAKYQQAIEVEVE